MSTLYVVATPIGNLDDLTHRAIKILDQVELVAAEDTRRSGQLLSHLGLNKSLVSLHSHNEGHATELVFQSLNAGHAVALISDAGTPLVSDPGFELVRRCQNHGIAVVPIPGPSAVTTALSVAGIACHRFSFEGFVPSKAQSRTQFFQNLLSEERAIVVFEAPHRIAACVATMSEVFPLDRDICICRELTKTYEQIKKGSIQEISTALANGDIPEKGEFVIVISAGEKPESVELDPLLSVLMTELPDSRVAALAAKITGQPKSAVYDRVQQLKQT